MSTSQLFEYTPGTVDRDDPLHGELMELNMGPQHPATHGVLRIKVVLDGETTWRPRYAKEALSASKVTLTCG